MRYWLQGFGVCMSSLMMVSLSSAEFEADETVLEPLPPRPAPVAFDPNSNGTEFVVEDRGTEDVDRAAEALRQPRNVLAHDDAGDSTRGRP